MTNSLKYPLESTLTGDLALHTDLTNRFASRAHLLVHVAPGDRPLLPAFGTNIRPATPTNLAVDAPLLQAKLNEHCAEGGTRYTVVNSGTASRPTLEVTWI